MGTTQTKSLTQNGEGNKQLKPMRERLRYGVCSVKIAPVSNGQRRSSERLTSYFVSPRGSIIHGTQCNPQVIQRALQNSGFPVQPPIEIALADSRAHKLLVVYSNGWHAIPSTEAFSRHSGTCVVLGDRTAVSPPYKIKIGDCFRLGSVGVVVSEMRVKDGEEQRLDAKMLQCLRDDALTLESGDELATLAVDEGDQYRDADNNVIENNFNNNLNILNNSGKDKNDKNNDRGDNESVLDTNSVKSVDPNMGGGVGGGEKFICYMCYETHDTPEDPLVAPCECKGDTRYLHVQCLQRWYHSSVCGPQAQVIRTTGNGAPACKICGTAYKTAFKRFDGKRANLLELENSRPYLSLVVVTRHDTNNSLFNTKFRLNFGRLNNSEQLSDLIENPNELVIGRSSSCNMVLDYRTVSTVHAKITYENGSFFLQDKKSSNGTMMYLQEPFPLYFSHPTRLRMGRTTITLQPKRSMTATVREAFSRKRNNENNDEKVGSYFTPSQFQSLMANANNIINNTTIPLSNNRENRENNRENGRHGSNSNNNNNRENNRENNNLNNSEQPTQPVRLQTLAEYKSSHPEEDFHTMTDIYSYERFKAAAMVHLEKEKNQKSEEKSEKKSFEKNEKHKNENKDSVISTNTDLNMDKNNDYNDYENDIQKEYNLGSQRIDDVHKILTNLKEEAIREKEAKRASASSFPKQISSATEPPQLLPQGWDKSNDLSLINNNKMKINNDENGELPISGVFTSFRNSNNNLDTFVKMNGEEEAN